MTSGREEKRTIPKAEQFDILTILGHDLKSPLNAVESYLDIMQKGMLGNRVADYLPLVKKSIRRMRQMRELITDTVAWAQIHTDEPLGEEKPLDLAELVRDVSDTLRETALQRQICISLAADGPIICRGVAGELALMVRHLLDNAIKYNKESGSVVVSLKESGTGIVLEVADTGIGMTPEETGKIFRELVRIRNDRTAECLGTGLGLPIARKLAERYGGEIRVESEPGRGSRFTVLLPRLPD